MMGMLVLVGGISGCGSIMARGYLETEFPEAKPPPYFYRGVAADLEKFAEVDSDAPAWLLPLVVLPQAFGLTVDLAADTLFLPADLVVWLRADGNGTCSDGIDNDGDGLIDSGEDPGCRSPD
jgi:hypothetical protein